MKNLEEIKKALTSPNKGHNSMGCSESYYNKYYMVGKCFTDEELKTMDETQLENLLKLADFAADVFY